MTECVKLTSVEIPRAWDLIHQTMMECLPPTFAGDGEESKNRFYQAFIDDMMQAWIVREADTLKGVVVTMISGDQFSLEQDLLIYSMWGSGELDEEAFRTGWDVLARFAKGIGCKRMTFYTEHDRLVDVVRKSTGDEPLIQQYVSFPVDSHVSQQVIEVGG